MIYLFVVIVLFVLFVFIFFKIKKYKNKVISNIINLFNEYNLINIKNNLIILEKDNIKVYIKIFFIFINKEIVLNSKTVWQVKNPFHTENEKFKRLKGIEQIINLQGKKLFIIAPSCSNILMYLNESDIIIADNKTNCYDSRVLRYNDFLNNFNLIKEDYLS